MGLPRRASQLPLTAITLGLQAWERSRGVREFATRRANEALQIAAHTPLGRLLPQQVFGDDADEEAARIAAEARGATEARGAAGATAAAPAAAAPAKPHPAPKPPAERARPAQPQRPVATKPQEPPAEAKEVGAPGAVTSEVEEITEQLHVEAPEHREELPIPDFDNISIGSLRARLRSLTVEQLVVLREWEQQHANRLQVVTTLDNRIAKLADDGDTAKQATARKRTPGDVGAKGTDYPQEAVRAERTAEEEGGTLRI